MVWPGYIEKIKKREESMKKDCMRVKLIGLVGEERHLQDGR